MPSKYRTYRTPKEGIGVGGVIAEIAYLSVEAETEGKIIDAVTNGIHIDKVVEGLMERHSVHSEYALQAIDLAKLCGVIREDDDGKLYVLPRPD